MRILQLHSDYIEYQPIKKEIELADKAEVVKNKLDEIVVLFTAVEEIDDESVPNKAAESIKASTNIIGCRRVLIYPYAHLSNNLSNPSKAIKIIKLLVEACRKHDLDVSQAPFGWTKSFNIQVKGHPLAEQSKFFSSTKTDPEKVSKAIKAEAEINSTWFILKPDENLIPLDDYRFNKKDKLEKLAKYEITKSRAVHQTPPHVDLMTRLELVGYEPGSDPGNLRFYPKGRLIKALLERYVSEKINEYGGIEVETPIMYDTNHPALSDYLDRFPARQYIVKSDDRDLFLRFSACFGQFLMAKDAQISYKHLPLKIYELTRYSFRREKSGELVGLRRLRAFTMPDCHALCIDLKQAKDEIITRFNLSENILKGIGLESGDYECAIRLTKDFFNENKDFIHNIVRELGKPVLIEMWSERFFYFVFKWEFNFVDALGKASALSTDQLDVENSKRYGIQFIAEDGSKAYPWILHNSPSGAIERCIYALLEKTSMDQRIGKVPSLPVWLSPTQVRLIPFSKDYVDRVSELATILQSKSMRVDIDDRDETVQKRIRDSERDWVPFTVVYGGKEASSGLLQVRDRVAKTLKSMSIADLEKILYEQCNDKPFLNLPLNIMLSKRPKFS